MTIRFAKKLFLIAVLLAGISACRPIVDTKGHTTDPEDFKQIIIGQSRADDVQALLGSPTTRSNFGDETWYYINERKETFGMWAPEVADQMVTAVHFNAAHTVTAIDSYTKADGKAVQVVEKKTPTEGRHLSVVEQLLGNVGKFGGGPGRQIDPRTMGR